MEKEYKPVMAFDFDGTISDSMSVILDGVNHAATKFNFSKVSKSDFKRFRTMSIPNIKKELGIGLLETPRIASWVRKWMYENRSRLKPIVGMESVLKTLRDSNIPIVVLSTNRRDTIESFFQEFELPKPELIFTPEKLGGKTPVLKSLKDNFKDYSHLIYVCDELRDVVSCAESNTYSIHVNWGANSQEAIAKTGASFFASEPHEILTFMNQQALCFPSNLLPQRQSPFVNMALSLAEMLFPKSKTLAAYFQKRLQRVINYEISTGRCTKEQWLEYLRSLKGRKTGIKDIDRAVKNNGETDLSKLVTLS